MKKIKIAIIIIALIAIIMTVILVINNNNKENNNKHNEPVTGMKAHEESKEPGLTEYLTVENCITKYLNIINKENTSYYTTDEKGNKKTLMNQEDIENIIKSVTSENVTEKTEMLDEKVIFTPIKMVKAISGRVETYVAQGVISTLNMKYISDVNFIVNLDTQNQTYSVEQIKSNNDDINNLEIEELKSIEKNKFNSYSYTKIDEQNKCMKYLNNLKQLLLLKPKVVYNCLNEDYKTKRFKDYDDFENYVKNNKNTIKEIVLKNYKIGDEGKQIYISDQYSNTYKFDIEGTMKYKVQLDNYIIMIDEEIEKYKGLSDQQKTAYNVKRWIKMLNSKDYEFAYNYLDKTFRENKFGSVENFEKYIKQNWPEYINIKCSNYKEVSELGTIDGKISERGVTEEELNKVIDKTFIVKLIDDTDFTMSFNIE